MAARRAAKRMFHSSGFVVTQSTMPSMAWAKVETNGAAVIISAQTKEAHGGAAINGIGEDELLHGVSRVCFS